MCDLPERTVQRHTSILARKQIIKITPSRGPSTYSIHQNVWAKRGRFIVLPRWWWLPHWSETATYAWLLSRACLIETLEENENGCVDDRRIVTQAEIARDTGLSTKSVRRALDHLEWMKFIERSQCQGPDPEFDFGILPVTRYA